MSTRVLRSTAILALCFLPACDASRAITGPSQVPAGLAGDWSGTAEDASGPGHMTWRLSEVDGWFAGSVSLLEDTTSALGYGSVTGTVEGTTVAFTVTIPAGGFSAPYAHCSASLTGTATLGRTRMTGVFSGTNTCSGAVTDGTFTLVRP